MSNTASRRAILTSLGATLALGACSLPRGAAIRAEITRGADTDQGNYAFYKVSQDLLPAVATWPSLDTETARTWPRASRGSAGRVIAAGDNVALRVWDSADNSLLTSVGQRQADLGVMTVSPSGRVFIPYLGEVRIAGMSPERARAVLQNQLATVSPSVQLQLDLQEGQFNSVELADGVAKPGVYPMPSRDVSVLALISQAGGVQRNLRNPRVTLQRGAHLYATSLDRLYTDPALDALARPGDTFIIKEDQRYFLALGASGKENLVYFQKDTLTALEAISLIGGLADTRADPDGVLILRQYPATALLAGTSGPRRQRVIFSIDMTSADGLFSAQNFQIMPKDVVLATESPVASIQTAFGLLGGGLRLSTQISG